LALRSTRLMRFNAARSIASSSLNAAEASSSAVVSPAAYPYLKDVPILPSTAPSLPSKIQQRMLRGRGLMYHVNKTLPTPQARSLLDTLFSKTHPDRLRPGSVLSVTMEHAPTNFSGVLIAVRHKGPDTSFTLRNVVQRTGVEMTFMATSPSLKDINVIYRGGSGGGRSGRRARRAKLFYLRDDPAKMTAISTSIKRTQG